MIRGIVRSVDDNGSVEFEQTDPPSPGKSTILHYLSAENLDGEVSVGDEVILSLRKVHPPVAAHRSTWEIAQELRAVGERRDASGGQHSATRTMATLGFELADRVLADKPRPAGPELIDIGVKALLDSGYHEDFEGDVQQAATTVIGAVLAHNAQESAGLDVVVTQVSPDPRVSVNGVEYVSKAEFDRARRSGPRDDLRTGGTY